MWSETKEKESNLYLPKIAMLFGVAPSAKNNDFTARLRHLPSLFIFIFCAIYFQNGVILLLRANPSVCPRRRRRHVRTSKNTVFCGTKCTCPWSWLSSWNAQLTTCYLCVDCCNNNIIINIIIITCYSLLPATTTCIITITTSLHYHHHHYIIIIIKPLLKIFNERRSLTEWEN